MLRPALSFLVLAALASPARSQLPEPFRPNVLLVNVDDAGLEIGAYGDALTHTPTIDKLAADGVRFTRAFVTSPICSPSRTALITGMYPTSTGGHHHRSQRVGPAELADAGTPLAASYALADSVPFLPRLFREAGYYVTLDGWQKGADGLAKSDYNFTWDRADYDGADWRARAPGQPFFAQLQLEGGKLRGDHLASAQAMTDRVAHPVRPQDVALPPAYPDLPELRLDWAGYLSTWEETDGSLRAALDALDAAGVLDSTVVVFTTDHGVSHLRGKQFLTDEGMRVPLIVRFPSGIAPPDAPPGTVRGDLVSHIDVSATVLAVAGIAPPLAMQGRDLFARDLTPRPYVVAARDRADETLDLIRAVRTERFKYVRNAYADRPHLQGNQYKDSKDVVRAARRAHAEEQTTALQDRVLFAPQRTPEELYDLAADPYETVNLAADPAHRPTLDSLRAVLHAWMARTGDLGLIPEPVLETLGVRYGSKATIGRHLDLPALQRRSWAAIEAAERGDGAALAVSLGDPSASVRYWAAYGLARMGRRADADALRQALGDPEPAVRAAAARSLALAGHPAEGIDALAALASGPAQYETEAGLLYALTFAADVLRETRVAAPPGLAARLAEVGARPRKDLAGRAARDGLAAIGGGAE